MEIKDYGSNSYKSKEREAESKPERKEKVTSGKVSTKKQSISRKVGDNLFVEDIKKVKDYLIWDIAIPAAKKLISESVSSGVDMMLYGETRRHDRRDSGYPSRRDYTRAYDDRDRRDRGKLATRGGTYSYEEVIFDTSDDAYSTLDEMWKDLQQYKAVSIADMYDHAGVTSERYTDNKYGWTDLGDSTVGRNSDGTYYLKLPRPRSLD